MEPANLRVLNLLMNRKAKGITFSDFPIGFRLGARIYDLRQAGKNIISKKEEMAGCIRARYFLISQVEQ